MFSRAALTVFVLVLAEIALLGLAVRAAGAAVVVVAVLASAAIGGALLRRHLSGLLVEVPAGLGLMPGRGTDDQRITDCSLLVLAGALLVVPGLLTSAVGGLLTVKPLRVVAAGWIRPLLSGRVSWLGPSSPANGRSPRRRDVVDVDVVAEDMPKSARSELN